VRYGEIVHVLPRDRDVFCFRNYSSDLVKFGIQDYANNCVVCLIFVANGAI